MNLETAAEQLVKIVDECRREVFHDIGKLHNTPIISTKKYDELVTDYDTRASSFVIDRLERQFPGIPSLSEESPPEVFTDTPDLFWLIDPLDGTTNFIQGIPFISVSISLVVSGRPVIGVTGSIINGDVYYAWKGGGFFKNGTKIKRNSNPDTTILMTGFCHNRATRDLHLKNLRVVDRHFTDIRILGSACLGLCFLCEGRFDAQFEMLKAWDCYAGEVMAGEVGLTVQSADADTPLNSIRYFACGEKDLVDKIMNDADLDLTSYLD